MKYILYILLILLTACATRPVSEPVSSGYINSIKVKFSEDVIVNPDALVLTGDEYGAVDIGGFSHIECVVRG